jgi:hypothetical protein
MLSVVQCSYGRPTQVSRSLEVFKCSSASLRRTWPYYWDPRNERLVVRSSDGYSSHRPFSRGRTGLHFHRFSNRVFSTLPSACFPTEALERRLGFTRILSHGIDLPPPPVPSQSFEHFLYTQPEWIRRLLPTLVRDLSFVACFLENQSMGVLFNRCRIPVIDRPVVRSCIRFASTKWESVTKFPRGVGASFITTSSMAP